MGATLAFFVGGFLGFWLGFLVAILAAAARRSDFNPPPPDKNM